MPQPQLTHSEPWAHSFICCDAEHSASSSTPALTTGNEMEMFCCTGDYCAGDVDCCADPKCEESKDECCEEGHSHTECSDCGFEDLEKWACTKEGCHAIQQYLECCTQADCSIPSVPAPQMQHEINFQQNLLTSHYHATTFEHQLDLPTWPTAFPSNDLSASQILPSSSRLSSSPILPTHICHWQNCHQLFNSMPDLLGHVASDHLGAPGFGPPVPLQHAFPPPRLAAHAPDVGSLMLPSQTQAETDQLLSCLWDDCFPLPECTAPVPETCPTHQTHTHSSATGEPFSPQKMLRHVLEEHLGVPSEIVGWGPETSSLPVTPMMERAASKLHPNLHHHHHRHPPTPSPSIPSPPPNKPLGCLWLGCTLSAAFPNASSLMDHVTDSHVGKGKDSYTCLWDGCGGLEGRMFRSRQKILRHLLGHTGHRPFVCEICEQAFSEAAPLAAHMRRHAQDKPFVCAYPGCGKTFAISSSLTIHMRTHNGDKPFICPHCQKGFVEASNLTKHIRTHTGERPFACAYPGCSKRFPRPDQLKRHMAVHDNGRLGRQAKDTKMMVEM